MGVWEFLTGKTEAGSELEFLLDLDLIQDKQDRAYLKKLALTTVVEFVANTIAQTTYEITPEDPALSYKLEAKPNVNQTGAHLLKEITRKMLLDGEALVIKTDDDQLLVADDFERIEYAMLPDTFADVIVKGYRFDRKFSREDVIYIPYMNEELQRLATDLLKDYGELFGRIIEQQKRKNQLRASVDIDTTVATDDKTQKRLQAVVDRIYKRISTMSVAMIPQQKGITYKEHSKETASGSTDGVAEMVRVADSFLEQVARAVGMPPVLVLGGVADTGEAKKNFLQHCADPIVHAIQSEFNRQMWTRDEYMQGKRIKMRRIPGKDIFDLSGAVDKLIGAKMASPNELRKEAGMPRSDAPGMDSYYLTKNYEESPSPSGGGEENAESN